MKFLNMLIIGCLSSSSLLAFDYKKYEYLSEVEQNKKESFYVKKASKEHPRNLIGSWTLSSKRGDKKVCFVNDCEKEIKVTFDYDNKMYGPTENLKYVYNEKFQIELGKIFNNDKIVSSKGLYEITKQYPYMYSYGKECYELKKIEGVGVKTRENSIKMCRD